MRSERPRRILRIPLRQPARRPALALIPPFWTDVAKGVWNGLGDRHLGLIAAGVAFWALLAIFPGVAAVIALWGLLSDPGLIEEQLGLLSEIVPPDGLELIAAQVDRLVRANESRLGWTTLVSAGATVWSSRLGVGALIQGLNAAHSHSNRGGLRHILVAILLTLALIMVTIVALASILVLPIILAFVPVAGTMPIVVLAGNWAVTLLVVVLGISLLYRYGPNKRPRTPWFSAGLAVAVSLWLVASVGFSWFLANFGNYNEVYGSIGAVVALLMWFYISAYAMLLGALLDAEIEAARRARARDSAQ